MNHKLKEKVAESFSSVLPITVIVLAVGIIFVPMSVGTVIMFLGGAALLIVGMGLFTLGADMSMIPMGEGIGEELAKSGKIWLITLLSFILGFVITIDEPDLWVLAQQVTAVDTTILIATIALGVGIFLAIAMFRVLFKVRLAYMLLFCYAVVFIVSIFTPNTFLSVAFDSGGVTTGPMTVPFILSLGIGVVAMKHGKNSHDDSFGFVALSSLGPILAVLILGIIYNPQEFDRAPVVMPDVQTMSDVAGEFGREFPVFFREILVSLAPIVFFLLLFQLVARKYKRNQLLRIGVGLVYVLAGLTLFLTGVNVGFIPVGNLIGAELAISPFRWILIPLGMVIGYFIVAAEPAVYILNKQVEEVTNGSISRRTMGYALSIGMAASLALSMIRILTGISLFWFLIPGYAIALTLMFFVPQMFTGIAFDSGGVASGPMTSTFLLPFAIGTCEAINRLSEAPNPMAIMTDAFGIVAMVAMTPLITIQILGLIFKIKSAKAQEEEQPDADSDEIIEFEEV